jgi:hypothetical protein
MAEKATIKIEVDNSGVKPQVQAVSQSLEQVAQKAAQVAPQVAGVAEAAAQSVEKVNAQVAAVTPKVNAVSAATAKFAAETKKPVDGFDEATKSASKLQEVMAKIFLPAALLGGALKIIDVFDSMRDRAGKFRRELDAIAIGFEKTTAAMARAASDSDPFGDKTLQSVQAGAAAVAEVQAKLETELTDKGRILERAFFGGLFGAQSGEQIAQATVETTSRIANQVTEQAKIIAAAKEKAESDARRKKFEADQAAAAKELDEARNARKQLAEAALSDEDKLNAERNRLKEEYFYKAKEARTAEARAEFEEAEKLVERKYRMELTKLREAKAKESVELEKKRREEEGKDIESRNRVIEESTRSFKSALDGLGEIVPTLQNIQGVLELIEARAGRGGGL